MFDTAHIHVEAALELASNNEVNIELNAFKQSAHGRLNTMILETAVLNIKNGQTRAFEEAFQTASGIISRQKGYQWHQLQKCLEHDHQYLLLVGWDTLEDHTEGFRGGKDYPEWKALLHHFYDPFPTVEHYTRVF